MGQHRLQQIDARSLIGIDDLIDLVKDRCNPGRKGCFEKCFLAVKIAINRALRDASCGPAFGVAGSFSFAEGTERFARLMVADS